jgi:hypothetical protein
MRSQIGGLPEEIGRRATENEKAGPQRLAIRKHSQRLKDVRSVLNFVNYYGAAKFLERRHRLAESRETRWIPEIEVIGGIRRYDVPRKCGLAALTRPDKPHDAAAFERGSDPSLQSRSLDHRRRSP